MLKYFKNIQTTTRRTYEHHVERIRRGNDRHDETSGVSKYSI